MKATGRKLSRAAAAPSPASVREEIRCRAYQIFQEHGKIEGRELEDWLQAEHEIMTHRVMRRAVKLD